MVMSYFLGIAIFYFKILLDGLYEFGAAKYLVVNSSNTI